MKDKHRTCRECKGMYLNFINCLSCPVVMTQEDFGNEKDLKGLPSLQGPQKKYRYQYYITGGCIYAIKTIGIKKLLRN